MSDSTTTTSRVPALVFARLTRDTIRVILHPGSGQADGGIPVDVELELVPPHLRTPNTAVDAIVEHGSFRLVAITAPETDSR